MRDFSLRAWNPITGYIIYDVLVSKNIIYTKDLIPYGEVSEFDIHRCTGLLDVSTKAIWEKDLVAAILKDPKSNKPLKENENFYWFTSVKTDGHFTKIFQIRYSIPYMGFYLYPFESSEQTVRESSCLFLNKKGAWDVHIKKLCSPNDLFKKAKSNLEELEKAVKIEGVFK